jgi:cell filamentation protein
LAYRGDAVNHIHPFREGNGRTQRVFWSQIAVDAGWRLDWRNVTGEVNDDACRIAAETERLRGPTGCAP